MFTILQRLQGVRETGGDRFIAKCPAHDDNSPSLSIRLADDGRKLIHCFAGCSASEVMAAIGLNLAHLYPDQEQPAGMPQWQRQRLEDAATYERSILRLVRKDVERGAATAQDVERAGLAIDRLRKIEGVLHEAAR